MGDWTIINDHWRGALGAHKGVFIFKFSAFRSATPNAHKPELMLRREGISP
jgi:hypothetical protein